MVFAAALGCCRTDQGCGNHEQARIGSRTTDTLGNPPLDPLPVAVDVLILDRARHSGRSECFEIRVSGDGNSRRLDATTGGSRPGDDKRMRSCGATHKRRESATIVQRAAFLYKAALCRGKSTRSSRTWDVLMDEPKGDGVVVQRAAEQLSQKPSYDAKFKAAFAT